MDIDELRKAIMATPFLEFVINLADGRKIPVIGRDFILLSPVGTTAVVYQRTGPHDLITTRLITGLNYDAPVALTSPATTKP